MQILHGTWIPEAGNEFIRSGQFYLWVETTKTKKFRQPSQRHPLQLTASNLASLFTSEFGIKASDSYALENLIKPRYFLLPSVDQKPLPSLELSRYLEIELPDSFNLQYWQVDCYPTVTWATTSSAGKKWVNVLLPLLNDLHFLTLHRLSEIQLGADLAFWFDFTQSLKQIILRDQYIPALKYRELAPAKKKSKGKFEIYPGWEFIGEDYETLLTEAVQAMPLMCSAGFAEPSETPQFYDRASLLRHFCECLLTEIVTHTYTTKAFAKNIADSLLEDCLNRSRGAIYWTSAQALEQYQKWQLWRDRVVSTQTNQAFYLNATRRPPLYQRLTGRRINI